MRFRGNGECLSSPSGFRQSLAARRVLVYMGHKFGNYLVEFARLSETEAWFHDIPGLENLNFKLQNFPRPVRTVIIVHSLAP